MTWRAPTPKFPRVRCTACGREPFLLGWWASPIPGRIRETWRCQCGHAFTRDARVHHDHRDVQMEVSP